MFLYKFPVDAVAAVAAAWRTSGRKDESLFVRLYLIASTQAKYSHVQRRQKKFLKRI